MPRFFFAFVFAFLLAPSSSAFANCYERDPSGVKSDATAAMNGKLAEKDTRGVGIPLVANQDVRCGRGVNWNPRSQKEYNECSSNRSGSVGRYNFSYNCSAYFVDCRLTSSRCSLTITQ